MNLKLLKFCLAFIVLFSLTFAKNKTKKKCPTFLKNTWWDCDICKCDVRGFDVKICKVTVCRPLAQRPRTDFKQKFINFAGVNPRYLHHRNYDKRDNYYDDDSYIDSHYYYNDDYEAFRKQRKMSP